MKVGKVHLEIGVWLSEALGVKGSGPLVLEKEIPDGAKIGDLLREVAARHKTLMETLFEPGTKELTGAVIVVVNGKLLPSTQALDTTVNDGDKITLLPFIDGG